jgi:acetyl esterase/lipase
VPLHPRLRERIDYEAANFPDLLQLTVSEGREVDRAIYKDLERLTPAPPALDRVENHSIPLPAHRLGMRLYFPKEALAPSPVLLFLHGGGWVFGDLDTCDSLCREISAQSRTVVASVDYRRSPEVKFPSAIEDGYAALQWLADPATARRFDLRPDEIVVGGSSAGGNMAAVLAVMTRDQAGPPLAGQVLIYPVTGYFPETLSYTENATGFGFDASFMPWMWEQYLASPKQGHDPRVAPLLTSNLAHVAPALVLTAEYDLLRDEGEQYAARLDQAGVPTQMTRYNGMIHGFLDYRGIVPEGWSGIEEVARTVRRWSRTA